jgi:hypothetical protein
LTGRVDSAVQAAWSLQVHHRQKKKSLCWAQVSSIAFKSGLAKDDVRLGVIGLTTALKIQLQGVYDVTIIAETLPNDPKSIKYTSSWAVCWAPV